MKEIKAIIQPFTVGKVVEALRAIPELPGLTISHVEGYGATHGMDVYTEVGEQVAKVKLEIVVSDSIAEKVLQTIAVNAHTGNTGDGKIFIYPVLDVVKIRTNQRGEMAI